MTFDTSSAALAAALKERIVRLFKLFLILFIALFTHTTEAREGIAPLPCTEEFTFDFDFLSVLFEEVSTAVDNKADDCSYRTSIVSALNSCHSFVAKYVEIDPVTNRWNGPACTRAIEQDTVVIEARSHQAECDYLQRLLNRADQ